VFADLAQRLFDSGFHPIPLNGKRPAVRGWQHERDASVIDRWVGVFSAYNIGVLTAQLLAVDIDADDSVEAFEITQAAQKSLGPTAFQRVGRLPHRALIYRVQTLVRSGGIGPVDLLGAGRQMAAYGQHPSGTHYHWPEEAIADIHITQLPLATPAAIDAFRIWLQDRYTKPGARSDTATTRISDARLSVGDIEYAPREPGRNIALFDFLRREAIQHHDFVGFLQAARAFGERCLPPMSPGEVRHTASSVWEYKMNGTLLVPGQPAFLVPLARDEYLCLFRKSRDAAAVYAFLCSTRPWRMPFTIPILATASHLQMAPGTLLKALKVLEVGGIIVRAGSKPAARGERGAILYRWGRSPTYVH
jgi:hypothetical protein